MTTKEFLREAEEQIKRYYYDLKYFDFLEVIQVWYCKTIQNHKGIFIIKEEDGTLSHFIEVTYNGDKSELYLDFYEKVDKMTCIIPYKNN